MFTLDQIPLFISYFAIILLIILKSITKTKNEHSYLIGNRSLNSLMVAISACAADMSGWLLLGLPGAIYLTGFNQLWIVFGLIIGSYLNWKLVAKRLRAKTDKLQAITLPDYFNKICTEKTNSINIMASAVILFFFIIYVASGLVGSSKVFEEYFAIPYNVSLIITLVIIVLSTITGGFLAVSWTEVFQGLIMFFVMFLIPVLSVFYGFEKEIDVIGNFTTNYHNHFNLFYNTNLFMIVSLLAWGLGYFGQPHILAKFIAMKEEKTATKARGIAMIWMIGGLTFAVAIGILGRVFIADPLEDSELVMLNLSNLLLPKYLIALPIIAILSAIFSTASAQLLIVSSVITTDLKMVKNSLTANRIVTLVVAILATVVALLPNTKILSMVGYAWAGFGSSFGPLVLFSLYVKKGLSKTTILGGMLSGMLVVVVWNILRFFMSDVAIFQIYELLPAFVVSSITIVFLHLVTKKQAS